LSETQSLIDVKERPAEPDNSLVELREVSVRKSDGATELDRFSLCLAPNETVILLGETGSGADAVLHVLAGLTVRHSAHSGFVLAHGAEIDAARGKETGLRVAYLPSPASEPFSPFGSLASQLVRILQRKLAIPRPSATSLFKQTLARFEGAPAFQDIDKRPATVEPVAQAWALLAAAVAQAPELILADDPFGSLGPMAAHALTKALMTERERLGAAMLYAARALSAVMWLNARVIVMRQGVAIEEGPAERLADAQSHPYVQALFRSVPRLSKEKPSRTIARGETLVRVHGLELAQSEPYSRDGITFELRRGASLALIGERGAGRHALVRTLLGLERIRAGRVVLDAVDLSVLSETMTARLRRRIAFITGADDALDPRLSLWDTVDEPLRAHLKLPREMIVGHRDAALKRVGLASYPGDCMVAELAPFDKRRLQIARAIVSAPLLAVIDEPLRGLDAFSQGIIRDLLTDFRGQEGPAFLVITSDFTVAQALADDALILRDKRVIARGPIYQLLQDPEDEHVRALIEAAVPVLRATLPSEGPRV
jgi:peptide/nickel transport system ATP-binding protein